MKNLLFLGVFLILTAFKSDCDSKCRIAKIKSFYKDNLAHALSFEKQTGCPYYIVLAIATKESLCGYSKMSQMSKNYWGIKNYCHHPIELRTDWITVSGKKGASIWCAFNNNREAFQYFSDYVSWRYKNVPNHDKDDYGFWCRYFGKWKGTYSAKYASDLEKIVKRFKLNQWDSI